MGFEVWKHHDSAEAQWYVSLAGVSVCVQPLCMILWVQIPERVDWPWKSIRELPQATQVSARPFLKIRHLLLSLHFSKGFLYCLQEG